MKDLGRLIAPDPPTDEELAESSNRWWQSHVGINFMDYSEEMKAITMPFSLIHLDAELMKSALVATDYDRESILHIVESLIIRAGETAETKSLPSEFFLKLITRSPKDIVEVNRFSDLTTGIETMLFSLRCFEDLCLLVYIDKVYLVVRPFYEIRPQDEFRVFVKDGEITGISQYVYNENFNYGASAELIESRIRSFVTNKVVPAMAVPTYCVDVWLTESDCQVIETNPYHLSDPCLFVSHDQLDGSFKHNG